MIELDQVSVVYGMGSGAEVRALDGIQLKLASGSFNVVIGANGSGKSTLLNVIAGTVLPTAGRLLLGDRDITRFSVADRSKYIARVFQDPAQGTAPGLSLIENFRLASLRTRSKGPWIGLNKDFRKVVASHVSILGMGLESRLDQPMRSFSGGQRQALSLLMATFDHVDILLMDEPTAALDPSAADMLIKLAVKIIRDKQLTALMVTHELKHCFSGIDRLLQFERGKLHRDIDHLRLRNYTIHDLRTFF
jgi:putative ABC transport system ATP-binding protein